MKIVRLIKMCLKEMHSKIHIGKHLSDCFLIQNGLKEMLCQTVHLILTLIAIHTSVFWDNTPHSPLKINQGFRETYCLHIWDQRISHERNLLAI
jgi:hypothetical protein